MKTLLGAAALLLIAGAASAQTTVIRTEDQTKVRINENTGKVVVRPTDPNTSVRVRETPSGNTKVIVRDGDGTKTVIKP